MSAGKASVDATEEVQLAGLSGLELQHDFNLTIGESSGWSAVAEVLQRAGAELHSLQLSRQGEGYAARCRLKRISSEEARRLAGALIEQGVAEHASVEHLMLTRAAAGRTP